MKADPDSSMVITGGRVVDPSQGIDERADVLIERGRIARVVRTGEAVPTATQRVDARGLIVAPGFVDVHTHVRYPGQGGKETVASATAAAVRGGFTTVCAMANTNPPVDSAERVADVLAMAGVEAHCHLYPVAAVSRGLAGHANTDAADLIRAGAVALSDDGKPVANEGVMIAALRASERLGVPISVHEETPAIVRGGVANDGCAQRHGLPGWPCPGEFEMVKRDVRLLRRHGGRLHVAHVSCAASVELIARARERGLLVTAEAMPHHLAQADDILDGNETLPPAHAFTKVNPPLRTASDVATLRRAVSDGIIDVIATDHAPHTADDKARQYVEAAFGFTGLELALPLLLGLVDSGLFRLTDLIERLTVAPARAFNLPAGTLRPGVAADLCIFDPRAAWTVGRDTVVSKGNNTPWQGRTVVGRVRHTIVQGKLHTFGSDHVLRAHGTR